MNGKYYYGTGRRKSSVARVFLTKGTGQIIVNGRPVDEFFARETSRMVVRQPLVLTENAEAFDIKVNVIGGGETGQSGAIRHGIARALINHPALLLADEPTGNLDEKNEYLVMDIFEKLHNAGSSIIVVTHDPEVGDEAERMIVLEHGRIAREEKKKRQRPVIAE